MFSFLKRLFPLFVLILIISGLYLFLNKKIYIKDDIKLISFAPLSGLNKDISISFYKGVRAYFRYINEKRILSKKIDFTLIDDKGKSDIALSVLKNMDKNEPFAFFGVFSPCISKKILEIYSSKTHPFFMPYCSLKEFDTFKNYFSITKNIEEELEKLIEYLKENDIKRVSIFYENNYCFNEIKNKLEILLKKAHINWVDKASYIADTFLINDAYEKLAKKSPKAIFLLSFYRGASKFLQKAEDDYRFLDTIFLAPSCIGIEALRKEVEGMDLNLIVSTPIFPVDLNKNLKIEYENIMSIYYPKEKPNIDSFKGFLYAKIFALALENSSSLLSFKDILNSLKSMPYIMYNREFLVQFVGKDNKINKIYLLYLKDNKFIPLQEE